MSHTDIDRVNGYTIRKLHSPDKSKVFGFLSGIKQADGSLTELERHATFTEAREFRGFKVKPIENPTKPKSANPQNRPGYHADKK